MTLDRSLKSGSGLARNRSVLSRAERIAQLTEEGKFSAELNSPFGLPKVKVKHSKAGGKAKKEAAAEGAEGAAAPAAGAAAPAGKAGAPAAGKAAPAAGGKAAPAAKAEKKK